MGRTYKDYPKTKRDRLRKQDKERRQQRQVKHQVDLHPYEEYNRGIKQQKEMQA